MTRKALYLIRWHLLAFLKQNKNYSEHSFNICTFGVASSLAITAFTVYILNTFRQVINKAHYYMQDIIHPSKQPGC